jgi:hypothetical protein
MPAACLIGFLNANIVTWGPVLVDSGNPVGGAASADIVFLFGLARNFFSFQKSKQKR